MNMLMLYAINTGAATAYVVSPISGYLGLQYRLKRHISVRRDRGASHAFVRTCSCYAYRRYRYKVRLSKRHPSVHRVGRDWGKAYVPPHRASAVMSTAHPLVWPTAVYANSFIGR